MSEKQEAREKAVIQLGEIIRYEFPMFPYGIANALQGFIYSRPGQIAVTGPHGWKRNGVSVLGNDHPDALSHIKRFLDGIGIPAVMMRPGGQYRGLNITLDDAVIATIQRYYQKNGIEKQHAAFMQSGRIKFDTTPYDFALPPEAMGIPIG